ncbi:cyclic nucleotide-gated ion channel 2 isoform X2 [Ricinus communis]|uniref:cyclic nucleotide-gated ion channel 2 isoform X2 n=1 Tax=Ricinus communis TaxID=3988 RepID=UPI00201AA7B1|nr:cyclic nucleotide-gated ion channel 2 isoform X2 [Ricinus communis]
MRKHSNVNDNNCRNDTVFHGSTTTKCFACTQVGVPIFHSTSCDSTTSQQPHWQALAGSSLIPIQTPPGNHPFPDPTRKLPPLQFGSVLDPRSQLVQWWNRVFLLARGISLAVDPLFFYALTLSIGKGGAPCLYVDNNVAAAVTVARTCLDAVQFWRVWLQFRLAYVSKESLVFGCGELVWDARAIATHYVKSFKGFWFDVFVILPFPQATVWLLVPRLITQEKIKLVPTIILVIGGCWYVLATQSVVKCLKEQCERNGNYKLSLSCSGGVCYQFMYPEDKFGNTCGNSTKLIAKPLCLDDDGPFNHGIYSQGLLVVTSHSLAVRILYPIFWGLLNLSSFGNELAPTSNLVEVMFSIFIVLCGLTLFTLMVGNIQVFLSVMLAKNKDMQLKRRDIEWWMRRRQLPSDLRRRMRHFDSQRWAIMGGEDEIKWIEELPEGLRRDIKRFLCLDLIKKAPLFHNLDDLILDNICDRVKPLIFCKGEKIIREGDPVPRMYFIVRGRAKRSQSLSKGMVGSSVLEPGGFLGDELLSWCLQRPFRDRLPASSATFVCLEPTEAFGLDANHLRYITDHFRYTFASEKLKRTMRYYSSNWRTWAAVNIQFAWRRYRMRTRGLVIPVVMHGNIENLLRQYAAMFLSLRPHDHLE